MAFLHKNKYSHDGFFKKSFEHLKGYDFIQISAIAALLTIGLIFIYSTGKQVGTPVAAGAWIKQIKWILVSVVAWAFFAGVDYRKLKPLAIIFYGITILLLIAVLIFGPKINGAQRWLVPFHQLC